MDNDKKHVSKLTKNWYTENGVIHWPTPPQSPDLMPIELIWHELKTHVGKLNKGLFDNAASKSKLTKEDFIKNIKDYWKNSLTPEKCRRYIDHLPNVYPHVILNEGKATAF